MNHCLKRNLIRWMIGPIIFAAGFVLLRLSHAHQAFAIWYANNIYPVFVHTIGRFVGIFPFSVFEVVLIALILSTFGLIVFTIVNLCTFKGRSRLREFMKSHAITTIRYLLNVASVLFLMFVLSAGINYNRESFAYHVGITVEASSADELVQLYMILVERAHELAPQIKTDADGHFMLRRENMYDYARRSMMELNELHGGLVSYFPPAKGLFLSRELLSNLNIAGFFSPWTIEANYNADMPGQSIPFVVNHELAHVSGHMREDEANFIAYLAGRNSDNIDFRYSAVYTSIGYVLNALRTAVSTERYQELFSLLPEQMRRDFANARAYWQAFQGPAADLSVRVNDAYLRANRQDDGVRSYGRMVDLLLAYYRELGMITN